MNRNAAATEIRVANKGNIGKICWSGEWSFIEDTGAAPQKSALPPIAEKQPAARHAASASDSS